MDKAIERQIHGNTAKYRLSNLFNRVSFEQYKTVVETLRAAITEREGQCYEFVSLGINGGVVDRLIGFDKMTPELWARYKQVETFLSHEPIPHLDAGNTTMAVVDYNGQRNSRHSVMHGADPRSIKVVIRPASFHADAVEAIPSHMRLKTIYKFQL